MKQAKEKKKEKGTMKMKEERRKDQERSYR